jgi:dTMP kinase
MTERGKFIVIEGLRGSGKSTVMKFLKEKYVRPDIVFTREPGGSVLSEKIREVMLSEEARQANGDTQFGLIWASRTDHLKNTIRPALLEGKHVICDRFDTSTYGIQIHAQQSHHLNDIFFQVRDLFLGDTKPDLYIFLDVNPQDGARRAQNRGNNYTHFHDREAAYYDRMRVGYHEFFQNVPHLSVDANKDIEHVKESVARILDECIKN